MGKHSVRNGPPPCQYNCGVGCPKADRNCEKCGWNPSEEERRKVKVRV